VTPPSAGSKGSVISGEWLVVHKNKVEAIIGQKPVVLTCGAGSGSL